MHPNAGFLEGDVLVTSLMAWSAVVGLDLTAGDVAWRLHATDAAYSDFAVPISVDASIAANDDARFASQHHVSLVDGQLQLFDNGGGASARALRLELDEGSGTATIRKVWTLTDDDDGTWSSPGTQFCPNRGAAFTLDGDLLYATCAAATTVGIYDHPDGTTADGPLWFLEASCGADPADGFVRVIPLATLD